MRDVNGARAGARLGTAVVLAAALLAAGAPAGRAQQVEPPHAHGSLAGWRFSWPQGDPRRGREAFVKFECYRCHEVRGERFPAASERESVGPELSQMGPLHEPEYFAEAIMNPGATIERNRGYEGPDGSSKMPSFNDSMTVQELVDLVAFLRALRPPGASGGHHGHGR